MVETNRETPADDPSFIWNGPSERQCHREHQDALEATVFRQPTDPSELVLELRGGELRVRPEDEGRSLRPRR